MERQLGLVLLSARSHRRPSIKEMEKKKKKFIPKSLSPCVALLKLLQFSVSIAGR